MPSVTDLQQQQQQSGSSNTPGKSTPPLTQQTTSVDLSNADPLTQAIMMLEKKQRNLGKRKEKLESYQDEAAKGKELNKDQKEALAKYSDVLGQIDCVKELAEQFKKIQTESTKNQKRASKQAAEEKRSLVSQNLRQYAQIRYLLEHRPTSIKPEESTLLDELSAAIIPSDNSSNSISRSVDTVLSIYQNGPSSIIKNLTRKNPQEVRDVLEELIKNSNTQPSSSSSTVLESLPVSEPQQEPQQEPEQEQEQIKEVEQTNDIQLSNRNFNEYPLQFDTRDQNIPLEQIMQDNTFFSIDLNNQIQEHQRDQSPDPKEYLQTMTVVNSNINDQSGLATDNQQQDEQQTDEQWQQRRGNGNNYRGGQFNNGNGNRNFNRGLNNYYQQPRRGGPRGGGQYDNSYRGGGQRPYNENNRGRGGYRGNRGGGGYRGYNNNNGDRNGYQKSAQHQQVHSAPPS